MYSKRTIITNSNDSYYFKEEYFKTSFIIGNEGKLISFILDLSNQIFI